MGKARNRAAKFAAQFGSSDLHDGPKNHRDAIDRAFQALQERKKKAAAEAVLAAEASREDLLARAEKARLEAEAAKTTILKSQAIQEMAQTTLLIQQQQQQQLEEHLQKMGKMLRAQEEERFLMELQMQEREHLEKKKHIQLQIQAHLQYHVQRRLAAQLEEVRGPPPPPPSRAPDAPPPDALGNSFAFTSFEMPDHVWACFEHFDDASKVILLNAYTNGAIAFRHFYGVPPASFRGNAQPSEREPLFEFSAPGYGKVLTHMAPPAWGQITSGYLLDESGSRNYKFAVDGAGRWSFVSLQTMSRNLPPHYVLSELNIPPPPPRPNYPPPCAERQKRG
jgi:hypothetical protein